MSHESHSFPSELSDSQLPEILQQIIRKQEISFCSTREAGNFLYHSAVQNHHPPTELGIQNSSLRAIVNYCTLELTASPLQAMV